MTSILILLFILILAVLLGLVFFFFKKLQASQISQEKDQLFALLNQNIQGMQGRLDNTTTAINQRLDAAAQVINNVNKGLGEMQEIGRKIKDFQEFLSSPKLRGNIGEQVLNDSIAKAFPQQHYQFQYKFREGQTVDAVIKTDKGIIPIDAKFPLDNYRQMVNSKTDEERATHLRELTRAIKKYVDDVANKYILPSEGTVDFAIIYVPSETIYYEIILDSEEILEYARNQKILLVSPNTFFYYLRTVMMGLEGARLQEEAKKIWTILKTVQQDTMKFGETLGLLSRHLTNAKNAMDSVSAEYLKLTGKVDQIKLLE